MVSTACVAGGRGRAQPSSIITMPSYNALVPTFMVQMCFTSTHSFASIFTEFMNCSSNNMGKPGSSHFRDAPLISEESPLKSEAVLIKYLDFWDR